VPGGLAVKPAGRGLQVELSNLQFGQPKHILVRPSVQDAEGGALSVTLEYSTRSGKDRHKVTLAMALRELPFANAIDQQSRVMFVDGVLKAMKMLKQTPLDKLKEVPLPLPAAQDEIRQLEERLRSLRGQSEAFEALLEDLSGQVAEAFSREEWYSRWGIHFLPSLLCAHSSQQCNNFKDPGVQHYGGDLFADLRDQADEVFCSLEAPKPQSRPAAPPPPQAATTNAQAPPPRPVRSAPVVDMSAYYDASAG